MRSIRQIVLINFILALVLTACHHSAFADFPDLLKQVPGTANIVLLMKSEEIRSHASLSATHQIKGFLEAAKSWPVVAKWEPEQMVIAAEMDIQHMAPAWEMAAIGLGKKPDLSYLARRTRGVADSLMDHDVVWLENACVLATGEKQLTFVSPLNRQSATRWLRRIEGQDSIKLAPYLAEISGSVSSNDAAIIMAIDLENVFAPAAVEKAVANSPLVKKISTNPTKILTGIRGLTINFHVGAQQNSSLNVDFSESAEPLAPIAREMMIGALTKAGAMLDEFNDWEVAVNGNQISMTGKLSPKGLGRILGIFTIGTIAAESDAEAVASESKPGVPADAADPAQPSISRESEQRRMRSATQRYFRNVTDAISNLSDKKGNATIEQNALWVTKDAGRIEKMSTRNVDPEMVHYGQFVVSALNNMVGQFHQSSNEVRSQLSWTTPVIGQTEITAVPTRRRNYGGHVQYEYAPLVTQNLNLGASARERRAIHEQASGAANEVARGIMQEIDKATNDIRQRMTQKYNAKF